MLTSVVLTCRRDCRFLIFNHLLEDSVDLLETDIEMGRCLRDGHPVQDHSWGRNGPYRKNTHLRELVVEPRDPALQLRPQARKACQLLLPLRFLLSSLRDSEENR
jgi:hypothetical protein